MLINHQLSESRNEDIHILFVRRIQYLCYKHTTTREQYCLHLWEDKYQQFNQQINSFIFLMPIFPVNGVIVKKNLDISIWWNVLEWIVRLEFERKYKYHIVVILPKSSIKVLNITLELHFIFWQKNILK